MARPSQSFYVLHPLTRFNRTVTIKKYYKAYEAYQTLIKQIYLRVIPQYQVHIRIYHTLVKIELSNCEIDCLPTDFCRLDVLKECILSDNLFKKVPIALSYLKCLEYICLSGNLIQYLPNFINDIPQLKTLDVYDNNIKDMYCCIEKLESFDISYNYMDEPYSDEYDTQKRILRETFNLISREDICKYDYSDNSTIYSDDGTYIENLVSEEEELWDSEDFWEPTEFSSGCQMNPETIVTVFIEHEMNKGSFCPIDMHVPRIRKQIRSPSPIEIGQFDNASSDECDL